MEILARRKGVKISFDMMNGVLQLPAEDVKSYMQALLQYSQTETVPADITQLALAFFLTGATQLKEANDAYVRKSKANSANAARRSQANKAAGLPE